MKKAIKDLLFLHLSVLIFICFTFANTYNRNFNLSITCTIIVVLLIALLRQQKEHNCLLDLMNIQTESYKSVLKHDIKTPILAQMRAIELLLKGKLGRLNKKQKEMLKQTLNSCKHSYKIIYSQLNP